MSSGHSRHEALQRYKQRGGNLKVVDSICLINGNGNQIVFPVNPKPIDFGKHDRGVFYPADEQLKKDYPGTKYFVTYANDTKMNLFGDIESARSFVEKIIKKKNGKR